MFMPQQIGGPGADVERMPPFNRRCHPRDQRRARAAPPKDVPGGARHGKRSWQGMSLASPPTATKKATGVGNTPCRDNEEEGEGGGESVRQELLFAPSDG
eukprot:CAMPEP_0206238800 /NCGR_PEP_ID=MMETSP0047_2-20121206/15017_1 /ASSEMBLY_ACC=CAM_ASM_000192 /TAXON_ID=195065 /ORGANISM="Chroomonas mesostigmatica_cf, Strain CCMP1168" /LENGTH=99 /DNA_ID=CAMNT_0053663377 /DNA_START=138 /DNA_END=437 /DNA_ORIENTATION=-